MKKYLHIILLTAIVMFCLPSLVFASDVSDARYTGIIKVSNNSTAANDVSVNFTLSTEALIDAGYITSNCSDIAVHDPAGNDAAFMPSVNSTVPWFIFTDNISAYGSLDYNLYCGGVTGGNPAYFPGDGGMTVSDNANIEPSANFTMTYSGYIDTTTTGNITRKDEAFYLHVPAAGNITAQIYGTSANVSALVSSGEYDIVFGTTYTNDNQTGDNTAITINSYEGKPRAGEKIEGKTQAYTITRVGFKLRKINSPTGTANITVRSVSDNTILGIVGTQDVSLVSATGDGTWYYYNTTSVNVSANQDIRVLFEYWGGVSGQAINIEASDTGDYNEGIATYYNSDTSVWFDYTAPYGKMDVCFIMEYKYLYLTIDGVLEDGTYIVTVPDTVDGWVIGSSITPYINYFEIEVDGVQKCYIDWEYSDTAFTDDSGNGNTAIPTFRTTSSDADVSAELISFLLVDPAIAPEISVTDPQDFYTGNITATGNFTSGNVTVSNIPGYGVITEVTVDAGLPGFWLWGILSMVALVAIGVGLSYARKRFGVAGGYVMIAIAVVALIFGFLITTGPFDWWMIWLFGIIALGIAVASRHIDLGGSVSQHGLIGFLAMSWVGLTLINRIMEGSLLTSTETAFLNNVTFTQAFDVLGLFTLPIINFSFFTEGIPALMKWDYSMFGGQAQIIQYMLYSITAVVSFIVFIIVLGLVYNFFSRIR